MQSAESKAYKSSLYTTGFPRCCGIGMLTSFNWLTHDGIKRKTLWGNEDYTWKPVKRIHTTLLEKDFLEKVAYGFKIYELLYVTVPDYGTLNKQYIKTFRKFGWIPGGEATTKHKPLDYKIYVFSMSRKDWPKAKKNALSKLRSKSK